MKTSAAPRRLAFFYSRPVLSDPAADRLLIAFDGAACRFLRTPAQVMKQSTDMVDVVIDTEALLNELGHARTGPQIGVEPTRQGTLEQQRFKSALLCHLELRRPSRRLPCQHRCLTVLAHRGLPAPHAAPIHTDAPGDFPGQQALLEQRQGTQAPALQFLWASGRSHRHLRSEV
jgi:hypothetical protein